MKKKKNDENKKILMYVYKQGDFVYAEYSVKTTSREHLAVIGLLQTIIEQTKVTGKWIN